MKTTVGAVLRVETSVLISVIISVIRSLPGMCVQRIRKRYQSTPMVTGVSSWCSMSPHAPAAQTLGSQPGNPVPVLSVISISYEAQPGGSFIILAFIMLYIQWMVSSSHAVPTERQHGESVSIKGATA